MRLVNNYHVLSSNYVNNSPMKRCRMIFLKEMYLTPHQAREIEYLGFIVKLVCFGYMLDLYKIYIKE
jgi:hypothetical protein